LSEARSIEATRSFSSGPPQRYSINYPRYVARGGLVKPLEDMKGFDPSGRGGCGDAGRFWFFCLMQDQLVKEGLQGDLAEVGVYKGYTATQLAQMARRLDRTAYLFDTYEGFNEADMKGIDAGKSSAQFTDTSLEAVRAHVGEENVRFVKGFFPDSASQINADLSFCLVHIDCDLYAPVRSALEYFYPRMVPGGFMVVHDYTSLGWNGAEKAVDDFFADKPESVMPLPDSAGSAVIRKARRRDIVDNWQAQQIARVLNDDWARAGKNGLAPLLKAGWSGPEEWGVWGVGATHELQLYLSDPPKQDVELDLDVQAYLPDRYSVQTVDVVVEGAASTGAESTAWRFSSDANRGVRTARIPAAIAGAGTPFTLQLRLQESFPSTKDERPLGIGLHRIRVRR